MQRENDVLTSKLEIAELRVKEGRAGLEEKLRLLGEELEWIRRENKVTEPYFRIRRQKCTEQPTGVDCFT